MRILLFPHIGQQGLHQLWCRGFLKILRRRVYNWVAALPKVLRLQTYCESPETLASDPPQSSFLMGEFHVLKDAVFSGESFAKAADRSEHPYSFSSRFIGMRWLVELPREPRFLYLFGTTPLVSRIQTCKSSFKAGNRNASPSL